MARADNPRIMTWRNGVTEYSCGCEVNSPDTIGASTVLFCPMHAAAGEMLAALEFVAKYATLRAERGDALPSQLTKAVNAAIRRARNEKA